MSNNISETKTPQPKRTPEEKGWWLRLFLLVGCFLGFLMTATTSHTLQMTPTIFFILIITTNIWLGVYSVQQFSKLPISMAILGILPSFIGLARLLMLVIAQIGF
ncbi:MAG: hypothetical protein PHS31_10015 [Victivallaceae bacterium]|nr:hypothetical protein [Victivallaceae bacterium]MDD4182006.1 hypothetical protein [Victivallaceae bacterium]